MNNYIVRIAAAKWYPVGIQDGRILDGQLNSSSSLYYATAQTSRLEFPGYTIGSDQGGWRPRSNARTDWLGVDLMVQHEIGQLAVQGSARNGYYVKQFELSYSDDDKKYVRYPKVIYYQNMHVCLSLLHIWLKCVTFVPLTSMSHGYSYFFSHKYLLKSSQNVTAMIITQAILGLVSIISMVAISLELYQTYF